MQQRSDFNFEACDFEYIRVSNWIDKIDIDFYYDWSLLREAKKNNRWLIFYIYLALRWKDNLFRYDMIFDEYKFNKVTNLRWPLLSIEWCIKDIEWNILVINNTFDWDKQNYTIKLNNKIAKYKSEKDIILKNMSKFIFSFDEFVHVNEKSRKLYRDYIQK